jgi:hypothetical protein
MNVSELFEPKPSQWGLRGDPYLWQELKERLAEIKIPDSSEALQKLIELEYQKLTGYPITHQHHFFIDRFRNGGMSSGGISPQFWNQSAIPLLVRRFLLYLKNK